MDATNPTDLTYQDWLDMLPSSELAEALWKLEQTVERTEVEPDEDLTLTPLEAKILLLCYRHEQAYVDELEEYLGKCSPPG